MPAVTPIDRAIDLVEGNLMAAVTVADMAAAAGYSLFHFCRTFNQATHHTPYDYLMRRRLSEAAQTLVRTDRKIIDVAFDYQFNSPETFSRAFKRMFDTQPSQWRREGRVDPRLLMPRLTPAHLRNLRRGNGLRPALVDLPPLQLTGLMTHIRDDPDAIPALWRLLGGELARQHPVAPLTGHYGVTFYPEKWQLGGRLYLAAVDVGKADLAATACVVKAFPAITCARFTHTGPIGDLALTYDYVYSTWLPKSDYVHDHPFVLEDYGASYPGANPEPDETRLLFPVAPQAG
ncbi:MAG: helix-turn-helix domain-containing protein [Anaerolineae bacterium]|nr:helix-turn-helix domain-containing protein [Anaerolineae bacterium]